MKRLLLPVLLAFSCLQAEYNYKATLTYEVDTKNCKARLCIDGRPITCMMCKREAMFVVFNFDHIIPFCDLHSMFADIEGDRSCCGCGTPGSTEISIGLINE